MDFFKGLHEEFGWFIWGLLAIGILWFFTGGRYDPSAKDPYIRPLDPLDTGTTYGREYVPSNTDVNPTLQEPETPWEYFGNFFKRN